MIMAIACLVVLVDRQFIGVCCGESIGFEFDEPEAVDNNLRISQYWHFLEPNDEWTPVQLRFSRNSDHVGVIAKQGYFRLYPNINVGVNDFLFEYDMGLWSNDEGREIYASYDLGLLSFIFDLDFPYVPNVYILYAVQPGAIPHPRYPRNNFFGGRWDQWGYSNCQHANQWGFGTWERAGNRNGQFCESFGRLARLELSPSDTDPLGNVVKTANLLTGNCGGAGYHGIGNLEYLPDGRLTVSAGDHSLYQTMDPGFEFDDACFSPDLGFPPGQWRAQRDEDEFFMHGKIIAVNKDDYRHGADLEKTRDYTTLAKGFRVPFRTFSTPSGTMYVGDVGVGQGLRTERIYQLENFGEEDIVVNGGWPCNEGVRPYPWQAGDDKVRKAYVEEKKNDPWFVANNPAITVCDSIYITMNHGTRVQGADPNWRIPIFEYRQEQIDPDNGGCNLGLGAITGILLYEGTGMGEKYDGALIFTDHAQKCVWYFPKGAHPPNTQWPEDVGLGYNSYNHFPETPSPKLMLRYNGYADLSVDPNTGYIYACDAHRGINRVVRLEPIELTTPEPQPTPSPPPSGTIPPVPKATICHDPYHPPEIEWIMSENGVFEGTLTIGAGSFQATVDTSNGISTYDVRTRMYNGMLPGPLLRMKACNVYNVKLINGMDDWNHLFPKERSKRLNVFKDPEFTNLHLHGMHVSGMAPGDSQTVEVSPGEARIQTYHIPCDHAGGTHWYHPHHHGSVTIQAGGGAAGFLVVDDDLNEGGIEYGMPEEISKMPVAYMFIQELSPSILNAVAADSGDPIWYTTAPSTENIFIVNGCGIGNDAAGFRLNIDAGIWTRVRILFQGSTNDAVLNLFGDIEGMDYVQNDCQIGVLALDGVYLSSLPRRHDYASIQLSISGRVDVAIYCPASSNNEAYDLPIKLQPYDRRIGTLAINVGSSSVLVEDGASLTQWEPCRPNYLMDLTNLPNSIKVSDNVGITVRDSVNGQLFNPNIYFATDWEEGEIKQWTVDGTDVHPFHVHVNHMQFMYDPENFPGVPGFYRAGDWVDTISVPGSPVVRTRLDRFAGNIFLHCHVYSHSDTGVVAIANVNHGYGPLSTLSTLRYGTCPLPRNKPYGGSGPAPIPGMLEPAYFDEGGLDVGYFTIPEPDMPNPLNVEYVPPAVNVKRRDSALGIQKSSDNFEGVNYELVRLKGGDWMAYQVDVQNFYPYYEITMRLAGEIAASDNNPGLEIWVKLNNHDCSSKEGVIIVVKDPEWGGSDSYVALSDTTRQDMLTEGQHTLCICMIKGTGVSLSSIIIDGITTVVEKSNFGSGHVVVSSVPGTVKAATYFVETEEKSSLSDMTVLKAANNSIDENPQILEPLAGLRQLGGIAAVDISKPTQTLSYAIEVQVTRNYSLGFFIVTGAKEFDISSKNTLALHCVIDATDCSATPAWSGSLVANNFTSIQSLQSIRTLYTPSANSSTPLMLTASSRTLLTLCWDEDVTSNGDFQQQFDSFFLALQTDNEGLPRTVPYVGEAIMIPGVIPAAHHDIPPLGFEGEGIAWHNLQPITGFDSDDLTGEENGGSQHSAVDNDWLHITKNNTWLVYSVQFTEPGIQHAVLNLADKQSKIFEYVPFESTLRYRIMLNTRNCESNEDGFLLMESVDHDFSPSSGPGKFAPNPSLPFFEVTDKMVTSGPQIIVLCFMDIPTTGIYFSSMDILQGTSSGQHHERLCYTEPCFTAPGKLYMEHYDYGGSGLTFYNKEITTHINEAEEEEEEEEHTENMVRHNNIHAPELIRFENGNVFLKYIFSGEWLSFTVEFNGIYSAILILQATAVEVGHGGLAVHVALDSTDCANHHATVMWYDDHHWKNTFETQIEFGGTLEAYGEHIITLCFDRVPTGDIGVHALQWNVV